MDKIIYDSLIMEDIDSSGILTSKESTPSKTEVLIGDTDSSGILIPGEYAGGGWIPTKVSQLDNDRYFIADKYYVHTDNNFTTLYKELIEDLNTRGVRVDAEGLMLSKLYLFSPSEDNSTVGRFVEYTPIENVSDLVNDLNFIDNTVSDLLNYYNKTDVDGLISKLSRLNILVVEELPTEGISSDTIYLLKQEEGDCIEYLYVEGKWEVIGSTGVDLTRYVLKTELDAELSKKADVDDLSELEGKVLKLETDTSGINQEWKDQVELSDISLMQSIRLKQDILTAGDNITITGNVISSTSEPQIQSDWNQSDNTKVDFIKNKPVIPVIPEIPSGESLVSEEDRTNWNNKSEFDGDYISLTNKPESLPNPKTLTITTNSETISYDGSEEKSITITGTGGGGTSNYELLTNKPSINNTTLSGNKTLSDLGIQPAGDYEPAFDKQTAFNKNFGNTKGTVVEGDKVLTNVPVGAVFTDTTYTTATQSDSGLLSNTDKIKLDGIEEGADVTPKLSTAATSGEYNDLLNKPQINDVELTGNKSLVDLGVASSSELSSLSTTVNTNTSDITTLKSRNEYTTEEKDKVSNLPEDTNAVLLGKIDSQYDIADKDKILRVNESGVLVLKNPKLRAIKHNDVVPEIPDVSRAKFDAKGNVIDKYYLPSNNISEWAKSDTKPSYTATEVGALPDTTIIPSIDGLATETFVTDEISKIPTPDVSKQIADHNVSSESHQDIRDSIPSIEGLATEAFVTGKISEIPIPDVSAQIETHNTSDTAHQDIRDAVNTKLSKTDAETLYVGLEGYVAYSQGEKDKLQKYPSPAVADKDKVLTVDVSGNIVPMAIQIPEIPDNLITGFDEGITKVWEGTRLEFNAITTKDESTVYHITDDTNEEDFATKGELDVVESIARGKARARVFDTVEAMTAWVAIAENKAELQTGDNLYIRATDVPDYWWDATANDGEGGAYELEAEKVDTSTFVTDSELTTATAYATETTKGTVRMWLDGTTLNIATEWT